MLDWDTTIRVIFYCSVQFYKVSKKHSNLNFKFFSTFWDTLYV